MKKYEVLLFDVDGTLLDFDKAEEQGIEGVMAHYGVPVTVENKEKYHTLNKGYWQRLERGELTSDQVLGQREKDIVCMRYGLRGCSPMPQRVVAKKLGISRSYVSRIEKKALEKLRAEFGDEEA